MLKICHIVDNARPGVGVTQVVYDLMTADGVECRGIFTGGSDLDARFSGLVSQGAITLAASPAELARALQSLKRDGFRLLHDQSFPGKKSRRIRCGFRPDAPWFGRGRAVPGRPAGEKET